MTINFEDLAQRILDKLEIHDILYFDDSPISKQLIMEVLEENLGEED